MSTMSSKSTKPISLFDLPGEIRNVIFNYAVSFPRVDAPDDKKWRGTTKALRLCRQSYQETHHLIHHIPVGIALSFHGRKLQNRHVFLSSKDWKKSIEWDKRWPDRHFTTNQIIQQREVTVTVCYFEWREWPVHLANSWGKFTLQEERDDHLKELKRQLREVYQVLRASQALEVLTLEFVRWEGASIDDIDRTSCVYDQLPRFLRSFVTLPESIDVRTTSQTHDVGLSEDTDDPVAQSDRTEHLSPWLRAARKNYLMAIANSNVQQHPTQPRFEPALCTRSDSYLPFFLDDKYMAHRKTRKIEWERKEDQKYLNLLEDIQKWSEGPFPDKKVKRKNAPSETPQLKFQCKKSCLQEFTTRRSFQRHKYVRWHTWRCIRGARSEGRPRTYERCRGCQGAFNKGSEYDAHVSEHIGYLRHWINHDILLYDICTPFALHGSDQQSLLGVQGIPHDYYTDGYAKGFAPDFEDDKKEPPKFVEIVDVDHSDPYDFPEFRERMKSGASDWHGEDHGLSFVSDDDVPEDGDGDCAGTVYYDEEFGDQGYPDDWRYSSDFGRD